MECEDKPEQKKRKRQGEKKLPKKLSARYLRNAGEYYLNRFPASSRHFLTVMTRKIDRSCRAYPEQSRDEWIDHVQHELIPAFEKVGFLNDALYAPALLNSLKNKGLSRLQIQQKLKQKGITPNQIDQMMACESDGSPDDIQSVELFARKRRIGRYRLTPYEDDKDKQRDLGKLARAGYSYDIAKRVFDDH